MTSSEATMSPAAGLLAPPQSEEVRWCSVCAKSGRSSKLHKFQINLTEAISLCSLPSCTYPLGSGEKTDVIKRDATTLRLISKRKSKNNHGVRRLKQRRLSQSSSFSAPPSVSPSPCRSVCSSPAHVPDESTMDSFYETSSLCDTNSFCDTSSLSSERPPSPALSVKSLNASIPCVSSLRQEVVISQSDEKRQFSEKKKYIHWWNKDALCWLDVAMCVLVHNKTVRNIIKDINTEKNLMRQVLNEFDQAQETLKRSSAGKAVHLETSVGRVTVKTGGGESPCRPAKDLHALALTIEEHAYAVRNTPDDICELTESCRVLDTVRERVWHALQPKMKCPRGTNDSPVFALPLILRESSPLMQTFMVGYRWEMKCTECAYNHTDKVTRCMPTFPNVTPDFTMINGTFTRDCFVCPAANQRMVMHFTTLPPVLMVHFVEGLPHSNYSRYDFKYNRRAFKVSAIIQYKNNPDHFVAWIRNIEDDSWMEIDDLKKSTNTFGAAPSFPPSQVHIVVWEEQVTFNAPAHNLQLHWIRQNSNTASTVSVSSSLSRPTTTPVVQQQRYAVANKVGALKKPEKPFALPSKGTLPTGRYAKPPSGKLLAQAPPAASTVRKVQKKAEKPPAPPLIVSSSNRPYIGNQNHNESRLERLRQNSAQLLALKKGEAKKPQPPTCLPPGQRPAAVKRTYTEALQPFLSNQDKTWSGSTVPANKKTPHRFQGFVFKSNSEAAKPDGRTADSAIANQMAVKEIGKTGVTARVSTGKGNMTGKGKGAGKGKRMGKGGKKGFTNGKTTAAINTSSGRDYVRGDPAAPKTASVLPEPNAQPQHSTVITKQVTTPTTNLPLQEPMHSLTMPEQDKLDLKVPDIVSDSLAVKHEPDPVLELFDEMNFGANIDFSNLDFNIDDLIF